MSSLQGELPDVDALWNYERPAETEERFLVIWRESAPNAPLAYQLELLTQIARAQGLQRHFDEAHATLDRAQERLADLPEDEATPPHVRYLLERGRVFNSSGEPVLARPLFLDAWERARMYGQVGYAVDAAHMLGIIEPAERGMEWNRKALALAQASDDPRARRWRGSLFNNMGWTYHDAGEYEQALAMFQQSLVAWQADEQTELVPIAQWAVARALRSLGNVQEALTRQMALLEEFEGSGRSDGFVQEEIGECLLLLEREEDARPHFARAWALLSRDIWLAAAEPERLARLHVLGAVDKSA